MDAHAAQWIGKRLKQEDAYGVRHFPDGSLVVICDGMGGHSRGDAAAKAAVESYISSFVDSHEHSMPLSDSLRLSLQRANDAVGRLFAEGDCYGGTTLLAVFVGHGAARWVSVGDSALYLWRQGVLRRLNEDHSMRAVYEKFIYPGGMTRREAKAGGHVLRSAVTGEELELVDVHEHPFPLLPGDRLILCSDGLENLLDPDVLPMAVRRLLSHRGGSLAASLVEACAGLNDPTADNATVVTLDV